MKQESPGTIKAQESLWVNLVQHGANKVTILNSHYGLG